MSRVIAFCLLGLISGGLAWFLSHGNMALSGIIAAVAALFGFSKEILEPVKQIYEIKKLKLEISEKERQHEQEQRRIVLPSQQEIKEHGIPYRIVERDILATYAKSKEAVAGKTFVTQTEEIKINEIEKGR